MLRQLNHAKVLGSVLVVMNLSNLVLTYVSAELLRNGTCVLDQSSNATWVNTTHRLINLRQKMFEHNLQAYIIPMDDEHQSPYNALEDMRVQFISGFSGSAGTAVVTMEKAALWTDGRYFIQAKAELDCNWILQKENQDGVPTVTKWLQRALKPNDTIGVNSKTVDHERWTSWKKEIEYSTKNLQINLLLSNLVDEIWSDRVQYSFNSSLLVQDEQFAGRSWNNKTEDVRIILYESSVDALIVTALDNIAWLLNLRGNDFLHTPIFKAYVIVSQNFTRLYVRKSSVTENVRLHLRSNSCEDGDCVQIRGYDDFERDLQEFVPAWKKIWIPPTSSAFIHSLIPQHKQYVELSPLALMQAVKNPTEIQGMKNAHIRDAVALIDFLAVLEEEVKSGKLWDESSAADFLKRHRSEQKYNRGLSFPTISAFGPNGAIIHYRPSMKTNRSITVHGMYLLDSGGQYLDGTTDVSRTFHFGNATDFQKEAYTRVLKGAINLAKFIFPPGITDLQVDVLARTPLFEVGLNYLHGTGHGIGAYLSVHEGPFRITIPSNTFPRTPIPLMKGMFMSDEPGFYKENEFGIRLENIVTVVETTTPYASEPYLTFEPVTLVPFEPHLIDVHLLSDSELKWLNEYHGKVEKIVGPELLAQSRTKGYHWMIRRTKPMVRQQRTVTEDECRTFV